MRLGTFAFILSCVAISAGPTSQAADAPLDKTYPARPIRWIVPYPAGASNDIVARTVAQKLSSTWGQQMVIDNRAGAGGVIAAATVARANPDGYTLLLANPGPSVNNPLLQRDAHYKVEDFSSVVLLGYTPLIIVSTPSFAPNGIQELLQFTNANPGKVAWGSVGYGSSVHIGLALFQAATGTNVLHVPYKGAAQALTELIGGQVQVMHSTVASSAAHMKARRLKLLAVAARERHTTIPDVPTLAEQGVAGAESSNWFGISVPRGTPPSIIGSLNKDVSEALVTAEVRQRLESLGLTVAGGTPQEFDRFMMSEAQRVRQLMKTGALSPQ